MKKQKGKRLKLLRGEKFMYFILALLAISIPVWKHIIRYCIKLYSLEGGYISSHVEKRRLEFFVQNLMTLYRVFIEKDLYESCMNPELPENAVIIYPDFTRR